MDHLYGFSRKRESVGRRRLRWGRKEGGKEGRREEEFIAVEIPIVESLSSFLSKKEREAEISSQQHDHLLLLHKD